MVRRSCPAGVRVRVAGAALSVALALAGCGGSATSTSRQAARGLQANAGGHARPVKARPAPEDPPPATASPALPALRKALLGALDKAGPGSGAAVYDLTTHQLLFALRAGASRPPASVEKIYTTVALLRRLGPAATLQTQVLGTGSLDGHGVWHGDLYLKGGGDPTFGDGAFNQTWELGYGPTGAELAQQLASRGIRRVTGRVIGDESLFDTARGGLLTGEAPDLPDLGGELSALTYDHGSTIKSPTPAAFAAKQLAASLRTAGVVAHASRQTATTPAGAQPLASVSSPPLQVLLRLMDVPSDDLFAEMLTKQLAVRFGDGTGSIAAGAQVISQTISSDYGLLPRIVDGSGLSRGDSTSPLQILDLLRVLWHTSTGAILYSSLPVVGISGTTRGIALKTAAVGRCSAKTGTLDNVTNLAGYCHSRGHHALAFALFVDGPANWVAIPLIGRMVAAIARY